MAMLSLGLGLKHTQMMSLPQWQMPFANVHGEFQGSYMNPQGGEMGGNNPMLQSWDEVQSESHDQGFKDDQIRPLNLLCQ